MACLNVAHGVGGHIYGTISDSCNGREACRDLAVYGAISGDISNSCIGDEACYGIAYSTCCDSRVVHINGGIQDSCHGNNTCHDVAKEGVINGTISSSCYGERACSNVAMNEDNDISHGLNDCCKTDLTCYSSLGYTEEELPDDCKTTSTAVS